MRCIFAKSVNEALFVGLHHLRLFAVMEPSRNGPVMVSRTPVLTTYTEPRNRVLVNEQRDANPFFHLFEALWMLAGRNDLAFLTTFVSTFNKYSDDGETLHGAYGYRWRNWFGYDQLDIIISELKRDPKTRRAVLAMWDASEERTAGDLQIAVSGGLDVPCNTHAYFDTLGDVLNMTVCCRSNDVVLGAYGANAVHFSVLLEYMAAAIGMPMGVYRQFSNNFHAYTELYTHVVQGVEGMDYMAKAVKASDPYPAHRATPLIASGETAAAFLLDAENFCQHGIDTNFQTAFFEHTVGPMYRTWELWKAGQFEGAKHNSLQIRADDWRLAAQVWLETRTKRRLEKQS